MVNPPPTTAAATIVNASVTTDIVLKFSGGTNTIQLTPQFSSNLVGGAWLPVPKYTNNFSGNGTNTIFQFWAPRRHLRSQRLSPNFGRLLISR